MLTAVLEGKNAKVHEEYFYFRGDASSASDKLSPTIPSEICRPGTRQPSCWVGADGSPQTIGTRVAHLL